jgi:hypothetical protein
MQPIAAWLGLGLGLRLVRPAAHVGSRPSVDLSCLRWAGNGVAQNALHIIDAGLSGKGGTPPKLRAEPTRQNHVPKSGNVTSMIRHRNSTGQTYFHASMKTNLMRDRGLDLQRNLLRRCCAMPYRSTDRRLFNTSLSSRSRRILLRRRPFSFSTCSCQPDVYQPDFCQPDLRSSW